MYLLFPGRHQLLTNFQFQYLYDIICSPKGCKDLNGNPLPETLKVDAIIFAVTSANHSNTRRNPVAFYLRALAIQEFARELPVPSHIYGIDDVGNLENFATYTLKRVKHESEGLFDLDPSNTLVVCSTPVLAMYERLGFRILPAGRPISLIVFIVSLSHVFHKVPLKAQAQIILHICPIRISFLEFLEVVLLAFNCFKDIPNLVDKSFSCEEIEVFEIPGQFVV